MWIIDVCIGEKGRKSSMIKSILEPNLVLDDRDIGEKRVLIVGQTVLGPQP